ncbi:unnamed protein product [Adineta ricciae]|uniref:EGF-like domain-containing protein n=1 Tax=Adineta ricciae TaxID=249248 RepID=A0A815L5U0_ADIRI|nr:unnamed protein product [Adineta ricciae]
MNSHSNIKIFVILSGACYMASMKCPPSWSQYDRNDTALWNGNCIPPRSICDDEWNAIDGIKCYFSRSSLFKKKSTRCNKLKECSRYGSDEQTCHAPVTSKDKYSTKAKKTVVKIMKSHNEDYDYTIDDHFVWACDRGIPIKVITSRTLRFVCLCPSSSYGSNCQYQSHRVSVIYTIEMALNPAVENFD